MNSPTPRITSSDRNSWNTRNSWSLHLSPVSNLSATPMRLLRLGLTALCLLAAGCAVELPAPPAPTRGPLPLSETDRSVVIVLVEQQLIPRQDAASPDATPLALLSDITLRHCEPGERRRSGVECVPPEVIADAVGDHPEWGPDLVQLFSKQNAIARRINLPPLPRLRVLPIREDPAFVPSHFFSRWQLLQPYPRGSEFYTITAPVYPSERQALIWFRAPDSGGGVAYFVLERELWVMRGLDGWVE